MARNDNLTAAKDVLEMVLDPINADLAEEHPESMLVALSIGILAALIDIAGSLRKNG